MRHGQLFAGIGGFGLAARWAGVKNVWINEIDPFCCKILNKNFPNTKVYEKDIREIGKHNLEPVDIISGGFPCQPFSNAGKRQGKEDDRFLWPEMLRIITELQPSYVIGENVAGLLSMENGETLKRILSDLETAGYHNEVFSIPAASLGAWHKRERIWLVSHSHDTGLRASQCGIYGNGQAQSKERRTELRPESGRPCEYASNTQSNGCQGEPKFGEDNGTQERELFEHRTGRSTVGSEPERGSQDVSYSDGLGCEVGKSEQDNKDREWGEECSNTTQRSGKDASDTERLRLQYSRDQEEVGGTGGETQEEGDKSPTSVEKQGSSRFGGPGEGRPQDCWAVEPDVGRVAHGVPNRVDRIKGLGNAIVPQVAFTLFKAIVQTEKHINS